MEIKKIEFYDYDKAIEYTWKYEKPKYVSNMEKEKIFYENFSKYNLLDGTITYYGAFENDKIIGIIGYHQNKVLFIYSDDLMIQNELLISILAARENVPFPIIFEIIIMEIAFELIREAGLRIPSPIGPTIRNCWSPSSWSSSCKCWYC